MVLSVDFQATLSWHQLKKVVQNSLPEDEPEADEAADVADAADSFQGKKCSEKGLASDINTSKVCLQTTAEAPGWMEMVEVIEAVWPFLLELDIWSNFSKVSQKSTPVLPDEPENKYYIFRSSIFFF